MNIHEHRKQARLMLDVSSAADAPTAYYTLFHPPERSALFTRTDERTGRMLGFVGRFQTGIDLFRPLVTMACRDAGTAADLLAEALASGRPYILFANISQLPLLSGSMQINDERLLMIYQLDVRRFDPILNVLVQCRTVAGGLPRCEINSGGQQALAGVNWQSPAFAEIYVQVDPGARLRGWGQSVTSAITQAVLDGGRIPIYLVESDNEASVMLAEKLGYVDTGARQIYADVVYLGHPSRRGS